MHFLIHRDLRANPVIRWTLTSYACALAGFLGFRPWLEAQRTGLAPEVYWAAVHGDPAKFALPMNTLDFATMIHIDLFFDSLLAIILGAVLIRMPGERKFKNILCAALLSAPIVVAAGGVMTFQGFKWAAYFRVASFWCLWLCQWLVMTKLMLYLVRPART